MWTFSSCSRKGLLFIAVHKLLLEVVNFPFLRVCKPELDAVWAWAITVEIAALH